VTPDIASSMGWKEAKGAIVASVMPGGPAARAGFHPGDIVLSVDGKPVEDSRDLTRRVALLPAGANATFVITHDGTQRTVTVAIAARKDEQQVASNAPAQGGGGAEETGEAMGLGLASVTPDVRRAYSLDNSVSGVVVTRVDPNSDAADKGIQPGDVVEQVANQSVHSPKDVKSRISAAQSQGRKTVLVLVVGSAGQRFVAIKIG
jgi:serine protease Do